MVCLFLSHQNLTFSRHILLSVRIQKPFELHIQLLMHIRVNQNCTGYWRQGFIYGNTTWQHGCQNLKPRIFFLSELQFQVFKLTEILSVITLQNYTFITKPLLPVPASFTLKNPTFSPQNLFMFRKIPTIKSNHFPTHQQLFGLYNLNI